MEHLKLEILLLGLIGSMLLQISLTKKKYKYYSSNQLNAIDIL